MSKPFKNLLEKMPDRRRERIKLKTELLKNEMALQELRQALDLTQEELARSLDMKQAAISKFEHQSDIYLSGFEACRSFSRGRNSHKSVR
jgi:DNA-binding XRE family transcriptional regulator